MHTVAEKPTHVSLYSYDRKNKKIEIEDCDLSPDYFKNSTEISAESYIVDFFNAFLNNTITH